MSIIDLKKAVLAVALTLAVTFGSGLVENVTGVDITPAVFAGNQCSGSGGGGC